jgi:hypothetical protein
MRESGRYVPWPSSLKTSSRFSLSFSFFPRRRFLPPCFVKSCQPRTAAAAAVKKRRWLTFPLFLGMFVSLFFYLLIEGVCV